MALTAFTASSVVAAEEEKKAKKKADPAARFAKLDKNSDGKVQEL